jgi:cytochrome c peroxidase
MLLLVLAVIFLASCEDKTETQLPPSETWNPTPYELVIPQGFPDVFIQNDNVLTVEGIQLGRMLYYDSIIDLKSNRACASCHLQENSFSLSLDNCMPHLNLAWSNAFLWDGKVEGSLEEIMLFEVEDFFQTDLTKLNNHTEYPDLFFKAFGTRNITSKEVAYALAQFERTKVSSNSKWDKYLRGEATLSQAEALGFEVFYTEKGDCFHCHGTILFTDNQFHNTGLDSIPSQGRAAISGNQNDIGKFKSPTLRNIEFTSPYMHDGRFETLEEVIDFYSTGVSWSPTIDPLMKKVNQGGIHLTDEDKINLIAFIKTLSDTSYLYNPALSSPF